MNENTYSLNWGGYRPGAGQKPKWLSGKTATIRVPRSLADDIMRYAQLIDGQSPNGIKASDCLSCQLHDNVTQSSNEVEQLGAVIKERDRLDSECNELAEKVGNLHLQLEEMKQNYETVTESNCSQASTQALEILQAAVGLKANAGGAIKTEIKRVMDLLSLETPTQ